MHFGSTYFLHYAVLKNNVDLCILIYSMLFLFPIPLLETCFSFSRPCSLAFPAASSSFSYSGQDWVATPCHSAMADSSIVTLGMGRSVLVDSSVYDSRMAETSKEQFFIGLHTEESEGK